MARWESTHTPFGPPGKPPYTYQAWPAMLYRATRTDLGRIAFEAEVAADADAQRNLESRGYVAGGQGEAVKRLEASEAEIAQLAANRAFQERSMSDAARAEAAAFDAETDGHVPVIPEARTRKRT